MFFRAMGLQRIRLASKVFHLVTRRHTCIKQRQTIVFLRKQIVVLETAMAPQSSCAMYFIGFGVSSHRDYRYAQ